MLPLFAVGYSFRIDKLWVVRPIHEIAEAPAADNCVGGKRPRLHVAVPVGLGKP